MKKLLIGIGIAGIVALALAVGVVGFWFSSTAFAQGPTPTPNGFPGYGACHNGTAVLGLLGMSEQDLLAQRQAGKSLLDIATAKGVSEDKLIGILMQPVTTMHAWMGQNFTDPNYANQMTQQMREYTAKDIRETKFGTMTDFRLGLGGNGPGYGMMGGTGMMGGQFTPPAGFNGMMGGGMMGRWR